MLKKSLVISLMAIATLLQADYIVKYSIEGEVMEFMYKNSTTSKMISNSEGTKVEIYHIKKNAYLVSHDEDGVNIVDVNEMKAKANALGFNPATYVQKSEKPKFTIKKTGKRVKVGGIEGEEWIVKDRDDGQDYEAKIVVTSDTNVVKIMRAMFSSISDMSGGIILDENPFELEKGYVVIKADGMQLESFYSKNLSNSVYELPKPTNRNKASTDSTSSVASESKNEVEEDSALNLLKSFF